MANYNTKHSTILLKPKDVSKKNGQHFMDMYQLLLPKFRVGDTVTISRYKSTFTKRYKANFAEELFKISKVIRGDPNAYELEDLDGEPIIGKFYEEELPAVDIKYNIYKVEKILKRKKVKGKKMVLVKCLGYDSMHNSSISESNIENME